MGTQPTVVDDLLTITASARLAGVSRQTIYDWVKHDGLKTEWRGRRFAIRRSVLLAWLEHHREVHG